MRIEELHLKNFRCFKELDIVFPKSNLAVFIGLNGAGKTAILDMLEIFLQSYSYRNFNIEHKYNGYYSSSDFSEDDIHINTIESVNTISINHCNTRLSWEISNSSQSHVKLKINEENNKLATYLLIRASDCGEMHDHFFVFSYYRANREKKTRFYDINDFSKFENWFEKEENIENQLKLEKKDFNVTNVKLDFIRESITTFFSNISHAKFCNLRANRVFNTIDDDKKYEVYLLVNCNDIDLKISQLSDGQKKLLLIVSDIASDLTDEVLGYSNYKSSKEYCDNLKKISGIVLIDEIELHLHPQWQREVLPALQKTFPNIQFIVTTHSPQVLSNLKKEEVFILKDNKISEFKPYVEGRDSNSILSEIFGVSERPKIFQDKLNEVYKAIDNKKLKEAKELLKDLEKYWGASDTEILKADLQLSFAEE